MALYTKYRYTFKSLDNDSYQVDLLTDNATPFTITNLTGSVQPFAVTYPETEKISYKKGSGCVMNIISETDRQLINLYTADMTLYQIHLYKNGSLEWCGYLDSELYSEPFNEYRNYKVTLTGNDGTALLSRFNYLQSNGSKYTGISSQWDVLMNLINTLNLPYDSIKIGLSTVFTTGYDSATASSNVLKQSYINQDNFYDEDDEPMTLDEVLQSILEPYGATMFQSNGSLYILDLVALDSSSLTVKEYTNTGTYTGTTTVSNVKDIGTIGWKSNSSSFDIISGINQQIIKWSPYLKDAKLDASTSDADHFSLSGTWTYSEGYYKSTPAHKYWTTLNNGTFKGARKDMDSTPDYFISWTNDNSASDPNDESNDQTVARYDGDMPYIVGMDDNSLKINFQTLYKVKTNPYDTGEDIGSAMIVNAQLYMKISIGNYYWNDGSNTWTTSSSNYTYVNTGEHSTTRENISDQWLDVRGSGEIIPLEAGLNGTLKIEFLSKFNTYDESTNATTDYNDITDVWVKDVVVEVVDSTTEQQPSNEDIEYIGYLNDLHKDAGKDITLTQGTNVLNSAVCLGGLMRLSGSDYTFIDQWSRNGTTGKIEELLLNTIVSNYEGSTISLSGTLNDSFSIYNQITESTYLTGKKFIVSGAEFDYSNNAVAVTLLEFNVDNLTINRT